MQRRLKNVGGALFAASFPSSNMQRQRKNVGETAAPRSKCNSGEKMSAIGGRGNR